MSEITDRFLSIYRQGLIRVAACRPRCEVADPAYNVTSTLQLARRGDEQAVALLVFPELGLSGYAIDDLLLQGALLDEVEERLAELVAASAELSPVMLVGAPLRRDGRLYNCAVAIHRGRILGVVRSEEHTSELQSLMRISYAVFCLKKKRTITK